jgi:starvation-inducible DNA-binding protein
MAVESTSSTRGVEMNPKIISQDHHPTLRHEERQGLGAELQATLVALTDLSLAGKQAHWNLVGRSFRPLHLFLDELVDGWRESADRVAERAVALGYAPDARAATVAARSPLEPLPDGQLLDSDVIAAFTAMLTSAIGDIRERMDRIEDLDTVTADLLHGVVAGLEENLWMIRASAPEA